MPYSIYESEAPHSIALACLCMLLFCLLRVLCNTVLQSLCVCMIAVPQQRLVDLPGSEGELDKAMLSSIRRKAMRTLRGSTVVAKVIAVRH